MVAKQMFLFDFDTYITLLVEFLTKNLNVGWLRKPLLREKWSGNPELAPGFELEKTSIQGQHATEKPNYYKEFA